MPGRGKSWQWHGMPVTVFMIGMLSIILLLWTERIRERLYDDEALVDTINEVQILTATYHFRLEEFLSREPGTDTVNAPPELDRAINMIGAVLGGGDTEHHRIAEPLKSSELRRSAEAINSLLIKMKTIGQKRLTTPEGSAAGMLLGHQFEALFREAFSKTKALEDVLERDEIDNLAKSGHLYRSIIIIWALLVVTVTTVLWNREGVRKSAEERLVQANEQLRAQTDELAKHRLHLAELVERRTSELTAANQHLRLEMAVRQQAGETLKERETQIRRLSAKLINAQEVERRRISMELHDELGQALNVTKLRLRAIERGMPQDQQQIRDECEELLEYLDEIIENVRRISLDLSPTVLEDLGLTAALSWLIGNFARSSNIEITSDIAEIDRLLPQNQWITVYRVFQEALTNIGKHAEARNVKVHILHHRDDVVFSVEDDGKGFELPQRQDKESEKSLGLTTMAERVRMLGGTIDLWSRPGEGTRVTLTVPVKREDLNL